MIETLLKRLLALSSQNILVMGHVRGIEVLNQVTSQNLIDEIPLWMVPV